MSAKTATAQKVALVTGGSKGIGAATALALARDAGFDGIAINYSSSSADADAVAKEIESKTRAKAKTFKADLSSAAAAAQLIEDVVQAFGSLSLLVNNAGVLDMKSIADVDEAVFDKHFNLNVKAPFFLSKAAIPHLEGGGQIIFLSSSLTANPNVQPTYVTYNATKGAIEQMSRVLAKELGSKGIRVNTVSPGPTATALFLKGKPDQLVKSIAGTSPFNRLGQPEEIANVIAFFASDKAAWVSGQNLRVNGASIPS